MEGNTMNKADIKRYMCMCLTVIALFAATVQAGGRRSSSDLLTTAPRASSTPLKSLAASATASLPTCNVNAITPTGPALVFNNPALLANGFGFRAALQKIIDTSNNTAATTPETLLSSMLSSYSKSEQTNVDANLRVPVDVRAGEATMDPASLVNGMIPVAVFNRFDLTPTDGSICGEHRIVYAKASGAAGLPGGRFFFIFVI